MFSKALRCALFCLRHIIIIIIIIIIITDNVVIRHKCNCSMFYNHNKPRIFNAIRRLCTYTQTITTVVLFEISQLGL